MSQIKEYTRQEVAAFNGQDGRKAYMIVNGDVLDVTMFAGGHPGGEKVLLDYAGQDATQVFYSLHRHEVLEKRLARLKVGELKGYDKAQAPPGWSAISKVPYAEVDMNLSPYYNETHRKLRSVYRKFLWESGVYEWSDKAEDAPEVPPKEILAKYGKSGILALCVGTELIKRVPEPHILTQANLKPEQLDQFHLGIMAEERARMVCPGAEDALISGLSIGLGPVVHYGPQWMQGDLVQSIIMGEKVICLAITEPQAGSDVAGVTTVARKSADGTHYVVSGTKKWITNAVHADYFTTLVRTGDGKGADALSMLLIPRTEGVVVRKIPTDYSMAAGTGLISFENVKVPVDHLLGKEGQGMELAMRNFNLERWGICVMMLGRTRRIIEETFLWANQRRAFGKSLLEQPVVRHKLGQMIADFLSAQAFTAEVTNAYQRLPRQQHALLGGITGMLKYRVTRMATLVADNACQIFGGRSVTKTGMGKALSRHQKCMKMVAI